MARPNGRNINNYKLFDPFSIYFHGLKTRDELFAEPEANVKLFLSDLAVRGQVAAATQNQTLKLVGS
jgi:hypothetical protein